MDRGRGGRFVGAAVAASLALLGTSCTMGDDGSMDVIVDDGSGDTTRAEALAADNAFGATSRSIDGAPFDGAALEVEYFEALRKGDWVAPDQCYFSTRVSVNDELVSDGFDGPRSDDDLDAGDGALAGSLRSTVMAVPPSQPEPTPDPTVPDITTPETTVPATTTTETTTPDTTAPDPASTVTTAAGGDAEPLLSTTIPPDAPTIDPPVPEPADEQRPAILALVAVYGHDQVVELSSSDPSVIDGHGLEAQPLDGWNLLRVALDPETAPTDSVEVTLRRVHQDGTETSEPIAVALDRPGLELLTDAWRFDLGAVDSSCEVPGGDVDNELTPGDTDILGSPVGDAPALPAPGQPPADPTAAADQALASLRAVYDLSDIYSASKRDHIENPDDYDKMRRSLMANDVVEPYMSRLDPQFRSAVFVSPTEAHVLYKVGPSYQWEIGRVLLIDGKWRVAAGTVCRDLSAAGYTCPGVELDPPPGPLS